MTDAQDNQETGNNTEWQQAIPEFARNWGEVTQASDMDALFNRFGEQRSHLGNAIKIPSEDAGEDAMTEFREKLMNKVPSLMETPDLEKEETINALLKKMGRPDAVDGYASPDNDELSFSEDQLLEVKTMAHELGLTKKQYLKFVEKVGTKNKAQESGVSDVFATEVAKIQEAWGLAAEAKYQETINFAKQAGAPEQLINALTNKKADAETVFWLNKIAQGTSEKANIDFNSNGNNGSSVTPLDAQEKINEIMSNPTHGYHKGEATARKKMHELMQLANPDKDYTKHFA